MQNISDLSLCSIVLPVFGRFTVYISSLKTQSLFMLPNLPLNIHKLYYLFASFLALNSLRHTLKKKKKGLSLKCRNIRILTN